MNRSDHPSLIDRRTALKRFGGGLGSLGLASALQAAGDFGPRTHFAPRAKRVIHLFMNGGPFGPDFFEPKPALTKYHGQRPEGADLRTERPTGGLMAAPYAYANHGKSGLPISELLPLTASQKIQRGQLREMAQALPGQPECIDVRPLKRRQL